MEENPRIVCQQRIDECLHNAHIQAMAYVCAEVRREFERRSPLIKKFVFIMGIEWADAHFEDDGGDHWDLGSDLEEFITQNRELLTPEFTIERSQS